MVAFAEFVYLHGIAMECISRDKSKHHGMYAFIAYNDRIVSCCWPHILKLTQPHDTQPHRAAAIKNSKIEWNCENYLLLMA